MEPVYKDHEFEALKVRYEDQLQLLRTLTTYDFRIFSGFITLQLLLGGWLSTHPVLNFWGRIGILLINTVLASIACILLYYQYRRRQEVIATVRNISQALGFSEKGIYLPDRAMNVEGGPRPWFIWYIGGILISLLGFCLILFGISNGKMT
jgi:hypothetical protein